MILRWLNNGPNDQADGRLMQMIYPAKPDDPA
jgi:hypothetical protein